MTERSVLSNGRFLHNLDQWTASSATYSAGDGDEHYGVAVLAAGGSVRQTFAVDRVRAYSLHAAVKTANATATLADGNGNTVATVTLPGSAGVWTETTTVLGLAPGTTYTLTISSVAGASIDDVWLWHVPATRAVLAERVNRKLGALATDAALSTTLSGAQTEGSYTDAIDAGLRTIGAVDPETDQPDVRSVDAEQVSALLDAIEREVLEQLQRHYAVLVDISVGQRKESLSQIGAALRALTNGQSGGAGKVVARPLRRQNEDYELS